MRTSLLLCALLSVSCDSLREEVPGLFAVKARDSAESVATTQPPVHLPKLARQLEFKLQPPAMPALNVSHACSAATAIDGADPASLQPVLLTVDARTQTKNLIPRRVAERLESGEHGLLRSVLDADASADTKRRDVPASATSLTREDLLQIQRQRFLGVFYITEYQGPSLILRVGKLRREWYAGSLSAKFMLFDTKDARMICGSELRVSNDVKTAPIRTRLQAETRGRLERELGDAMRRAAEQSTSSLPVALKWPGSEL